MMKSSALMKKESKMRIRAFPVSNFAAEAKKPSLSPPPPLPLPRVPPRRGGRVKESPPRGSCVFAVPLVLSLPPFPSSLAFTLHAPCRSTLNACVADSFIYLFIFFILRPYVRDSGGIRRV